MRLAYWVGHITNLYERAPVRQMLDIDAVGAMDWVVVVVARRIVRLVDNAYADRCLEGPELSSGWRGNLVFLMFWAIVIGGVIAILI